MFSDNVCKETLFLSNLKSAKCSMIIKVPDVEMLIEHLIRTYASTIGMIIGSLSFL